MKPGQRNFLIGAGIFVLLAAILFWPKGGGSPAATPAAKSATPVSVRMSRMVRLPFQFVGGSASLTAGRLTMSAGGEDEEPEGPDSFDVLPDGGFVVSDPLARRLAFFDREGKFQKQLALGFGADDVAAQADGGALARKATSGAWYSVSPAGAVTSANGPADAPNPARLTAADRGFIPGEGGQEAGGFSVIFARPGLRLASLEKLGTDSKGRVYVAVESASRTDEVDVQKAIRKYSKDGTVLAEISGVPVDYYVTPVQEFRLRDTRLYQLLPKQGEVQINLWDTSGTP